MTIIVFVLGLILTDTSPLNMIIHWYSGLWDMIAFAFQMSFMVVCCGAAAKAPQIEKFLSRVARAQKSRAAAIILLLTFGYVSSMINWAFSLILTPIFAMQLSKNIKGLHFPLLVAAGYSSMCLGQSLCPSASVFALLATKGHFMEDKIGIITQAETTYNPVNITVWIVLAIATILLTIFTRPPENEIIMYEGDSEGEISVGKEEVGKLTPADRINNSRLLMIVIGIASVIYIIYSFATKGFIPSLKFNFVIFIFLTLNIFLYNTPEKFVTAIADSIKPATQVMLQFPFYGGIMGMMSGSGLTIVLADELVKVASDKTMPFFSYFSASIINLFIPSQGGQWIVQGPILVEAAQKLNASMPLVIDAFVYGDEATNLIQPLYVIPALSLVNMKLKDVWGFMAFIWFMWFIITSIGLLVLPGIL